jgi:hypothetical protein
MRRRGKPLEISTFPFLAVLLCAMGSLILVLIVMDRKAKLAARYKATAAQAKAAEELAKADAARRELLAQREAEARAAWEQKRDDLHATVVTQQQALQAQIKKIQDQLSDAAARLKAALDDRGDLQKRVESARVRLAGEEQALATVRQAREKEEAASAAERAAKAKMRADLARLEATVKDLKDAREREKQTYSVVPYHGKHGESRRPLYVECMRNGVVFHPDGVEVPVGPNPAAARAEVERRIAKQREYLASIQAKADDKPYLMLLVRPDGITSYYELQSAVHGLDLEFGYEFVDAAWIFDFPKQDVRPAAPPVVAGLGAPTKVTPGVGGVKSDAGGVAIAKLPPDRTAPAGTAPMNPSGPSGISSPVGVTEVVEPLTPALPTGRPAGSSGDRGATSSVHVDPPYRPGKRETDFATRGSHGGQLPNRSAGGTAGADGNGQASSLAGNGTPGAAGPAGGPTLAPGVSGAANGIGTPQPNGAAAAGSSGTQSLVTPGAGGGSAPSINSPNPVPDGEKDSGPRFAPTQTNPPAKKPPPPLRVARLSGDRDYVIFIECRPDDVVLYPSRQTFPLQQLDRGDQALLQSVQKMIERRQSLVRPGELPFRPQVRFLVRPESIRTYHTAYPLLGSLGVPQTRQNLDADDDVTAIVVGQ